MKILRVHGKVKVGIRLGAAASQTLLNDALYELDSLLTNKQNGSNIDNIREWSRSTLVEDWDGDNQAKAMETKVFYPRNCVAKEQKE